ncbi:NAD(P)/FAD-dependent oxidoreductase [Solimonas sp. K1W22B-7]|uniref:flavin-containing monooxygenase n=1 Tax=Solimonas sp. K1W22B-7 TaxID=2303331 RepID=UPI000E332A3D|nr:NAD(P)-binding domain-containing protein [Solimonas sp. K1W22B-7]AXQ28512.1 NAD(P)/FAD-dependent oxidoreductase [Solimonas sp. K1W22B-7]
MPSTFKSDPKNQITDRSDAVCIVGAGPAGLSVARALKRRGIPYDQFERHDDVGGIWDLSNPGTPMYHSAHFISSRGTSGFYDFPMPDDYPDYPSNRQILAYTRSFARAFGLYDAIRFRTAIEQVDKDGESWRVRLDSGELRRYRAVVCATGTNWHPRLPRHEGHFNGEIRHSVTFKHADEFRGKRVLIVGLGNSGADIACDAAANADAAFVSVRRGYHFIPKHVFGIPVDEFANSGPQLPMWLQRPAMSLLLRMVLGDTSRTGMPRPDHRLFESHPLLNSQLLHYLQHGDIKAKGDVRCFDGDHVVFADGSREKIDLVLYATGYNMSIPYVPETYFDWDGGRPKLNLTAFNPKHNNLFGLGYLETNSSAYTLFDRVSQLVANYLHDQNHQPDNARAFERRLHEDRPDLSGGIRFIDSDRTKGYIEIHAYKKHIEKLRRQMGWPELVPGFFDGVRSLPDRPADLPA